MSDRIAIFHEGRIVQCGDGESVYERPTTAFVAGFMGDNNRLHGIVASVRHDRCVVKIDSGQAIEATNVDRCSIGSPVVVCIWPEKVQLGASLDSAASGLAGRIVDTVYLGDQLRLRIVLAGGGFMAAQVPSGTPRYYREQEVMVSWSATDARAFLRQME
jgi:putative spermidine/putrescine transport system ATP-binding protein